jgi:hypothetical protein
MKMKKNENRAVIDLLMSPEFDHYLESGEFKARWNALQEKLQNELMTAQEAADFLRVPFEFFAQYYAGYEVLRAQGISIEDWEREMMRRAAQ